MTRRISQEHAILTSDTPIDYSKYHIGEVLMVYPNHSCMTAAQHPVFYVLDGECVIDVDPVQVLVSCLFSYASTISTCSDPWESRIHKRPLIMCFETGDCSIRHYYRAIEL